MTKRDKREQAIRRHPKTVRFNDLDALLRDAGFSPIRTGGSHIHYGHPVYPNTVTVVIPHEGERYVKAYQVKQALAAVDAARAMEGTS